jgi:hypothetical protein
VIHQVGGRLCHTPGATGGANFVSLTGEFYKLLVGAVYAAQAQKSMGQDTAFEKGVELIFNKIGQARSGLALDLGKEGLGVFLY